MKDQIRLLRNCIHKDIPAVVFQGDDSCVEEILTAAKEIYQKHGCSKEFLYDWQLLIEEVKAYQKESPHTVHLPKLSLTCLLAGSTAVYAAKERRMNKS